MIAGLWFGGSLNAASLVLSSTVSTTLYGSGMDYTLATDRFGRVTNQGLTGTPVSLDSSANESFQGYATTSGGLGISDASLTLIQYVGSAAFTLDKVTGNQFYNPALSGTLGNINVSIRAGIVGRTISIPGATITSYTYDLFDNGFGGELKNGSTVTITFEVDDSVTFTPYTGTARSQSESLYYSDTRNLIGIGYLDVTYDDVTDAPEPLTTILIGAGLLLIGGIGVRSRTSPHRLKRRFAAAPTASTSVLPKRAEHP